MNPRKIYFLVFASLLILLGLTVAVSEIDLGKWNAVAALAIAAAKTILVALYFMHVRHSPRLVKLVLVAGFFWLGILFALSLSDFLTRQWLAG